MNYYYQQERRGNSWGTYSWFSQHGHSWSLLCLVHPDLPGSCTQGHHHHLLHLRRSRFWTVITLPQDQAAARSRSILFTAWPGTKGAGITAGNELYFFYRSNIKPILLSHWPTTIPILKSWPDSLGSELQLNFERVKQCNFSFCSIFNLHNCKQPVNTAKKYRKSGPRACSCFSSKRKELFPLKKLCPTQGAQHTGIQVDQWWAPGPSNRGYIQHFPLWLPVPVCWWVNNLQVRHLKFKNSHKCPWGRWGKLIARLMHGIKQINVGDNIRYK